MADGKQGEVALWKTDGHQEKIIHKKDWLALEYVIHMSRIAILRDFQD